MARTPATDQDLRLAVTMIAHGFNVMVTTLGTLAIRVDDEAVRKECLESVEVLLQLATHLNEMFPTNESVPDGGVLH